MQQYSISYGWTRRDHPLWPDDTYLQDSSLLRQTLRRFVSEYQGKFFIPTNSDEIELWFDFDLLQTFEQLPGWLQQIAAQPGTPAVLLFPSQGIEMKLVATRIDGEITMRAVSLGSGCAFPPDMAPLVAPAHRFLDEWKRFLLAVLDALAQEEPLLLNDREFCNYRAAVSSVSIAP